jgi:hypothetical protein
VFSLRKLALLLGVLLLAGSVFAACDPAAALKSALDSMFGCTPDCSEATKLAYGGYCYEPCMKLSGHAAKCYNDYSVLGCSHVGVCGGTGVKENSLKSWKDSDVKLYKGLGDAPTVDEGFTGGAYYYQLSFVTGGDPILQAYCSPDYSVYVRCYEPIAGKSNKDVANGVLAALASAGCCSSGITGAGTAVAPPANACSNAKKDGGETGVDCGGSCASGIENTDQCADGVDNDKDCKADCGDSDCYTMCKSFETCGNGVKDGQETGVDCGGLCKTTAVEACADGVDNDNNCFADCADLVCDGTALSGEILLQDSTYFTPKCEHGKELSCFDGVDNDGDKLADCKDSDCNGRPALSRESEVKCEQPEWSSFDGFDNDGDGLTDCADPDNAGGLLSADSNKAKCENPEVSCGDKYDNDADNKTDCADSDCAGGYSDGGDGVLRMCELKETLCMDGFDNDADGYTDCYDKDCSNQDDGTWLFGRDYSMPIKSRASCRCVLIHGPGSNVQSGSYTDLVIVSRDYDTGGILTPEATTQLLSDLQAVDDRIASSPPFQSDWDKLRIWHEIERPGLIYDKTACPGDFYLYITKGDSRPYARGSSAYVYTDWPDPFPLCALHEFGHSIGGMSDEYGVYWYKSYNPFSRVGDRAFGGDNCARGSVMPFTSVSKEECLEYFRGLALLDPVTREPPSYDCSEGCWSSYWRRPFKESIMNGDYHMNTAIGYTPGYNAVESHFVWAGLRYARIHLWGD